MSDDASAAGRKPPTVEGLPTPSSAEEAACRRKTEDAATYAVVVLNDEEHTFEYVTET